MVTHIGIINKGSLLFQGTLSDLHLKQMLSSVIRFDTNDVNKTAQIILSNGTTPLIVNGYITIPLIDNEGIAGLVKQLVSAGVDIYQISTIKNDLESIFIDLINN